MHWLGMIAKFLFSRMSSSNRPHKSLKDSAVEVFEEISKKSRKIVTLSIMAIGGVLLFVAGFFIALLNLTMQYDRVGYVSFTATLGAGVGLMVVAAAMFAWIFLGAWPGASDTRKAVKKAKKEVKDFKDRAAETPNTLEGAISLLVLDYVKERQEKRDMYAAARASRVSTLSAEERMNIHEEPGIEREPHRNSPDSIH
ncbi:hypothetical protein [Bdellovibrio reynosensis]|uniref:Phage holin family protein n=1 Tax=Bdellovibrio reynosensis TaxID=2835041 RepID=A0ABY4CF26_9BACT|nr:hypothetical protein [Bdellovibrio reynosensis]UOF02381.1 hypothetical protein MNR06_05380 [Bdellovibrio reynosensis]